jgi:hypothetical protein
MENNIALHRVIYLLRNGYLSIDDDGKIWRNAILNHGRWKAITPRRAENVGGKGYLRVTLDIGDAKLGSVMAHRVVWEWGIGPIPSDSQINHKDCDRKNNKLSNLEVVNQSENIRHSYATGIRPHPWSKATVWRGKPRVNQDDRNRVIEMREAGRLLREISAETRISITHIQRIIQQKGA